MARQMPEERTEMISPMETLSLEAAQRRIEYLRSLIEASKALNSTLDLSQLLEIILGIATEKTDAEAGTIYLVDQQRAEIRCTVSDAEQKIDIRLPLGTGIAGYVAQTGEVINLEDAYTHPRFKATYDQRSGFHTKSMLCMPMRDAEKNIIGVFQIMNKKSGRFGPADEEFLDGLSIHAALAIRQAAMHAQVVEKKKLEYEISVARNIQQNLLPKKLPQIGSYQFAGLNLPSEKVGGDYYDFVPLNGERLGFAIGDVAGKGIPAAFLMATLRTALHAHAADCDALPPGQLLAKMNRLIFNSAPHNMFITLFYGVLEPGTGRIVFVNAGHNPAIFLRRNGEIRRLGTGGLALGLKDEAQFEPAEILLQRDDILLLYTDGISEAMDARRAEYGEERLIRILQEHRELPAEKLLNSIVDDVQRHRGSAPQNDDITLVIIKG